ncbi:MAG: 50S ribosomal protein L32 [Dehalococcoidia bacterium]
MPPLPKRRRSNTRNAKRLAHTAMKLKNLSRCPACDNAKLPHQACPSCGTYNGRQVVQPKTRSTNENIEE